MELDTCIFSGKVPTDELMGAVAVLLSGGHLGAYLFDVADASVQALLDQAVDFYLGDVQPAAVLARMAGGGGWDRLQIKLLEKFDGAGKIDWSRVAVDSSSGRAVFGGARPVPIRSTGRSRAANTMS
jgi:hypothetical protein